MKTLIGGVVAAVLGIIGLSVWFGEFFQILKGAIPIMLLLGGALAIYLGFDELKDSWKSEDAGGASSFDTGSEDTVKIKQELDDLKKENEDLKKKTDS
ncbi:MAG: hypothetical protein V3S89_10265 [Desulfobacterales bacterium]